MNLKAPLTLLLAAALCAVGISPAQAATINVPDDHATIQAAIDAAAAGDTIAVAAGTYAESLKMDESVTLTSIDGRDVTTIELQQGAAAGTLYGSIHISVSDVTVNGFTIAGKDGTASASANTNFFLSDGIDNIVLSNNRIQVGARGAVSDGDDSLGLLTTSGNSGSIIGSLEVTGNIFEPASSTAVRAYYINPYVQDFTFSNNEILGEFTSSALTQAFNGVVSNNQVTGSGSSAGLSTWGWPDPTAGFGQTVFSGNTITGTGIGISLYETNGVTVTGNTFDGNGTAVALADYETVAGQDASTVVIEENNFLNFTGAAISNGYTSGVVDASSNYWGAVGGPYEDLSLISGDVDYSPWYADAARTLLATASSFEGLSVAEGETQTEGDLYLGADTTWTIAGTLEVSGALTLADGASIEVIEGELVLADGSVLAGSFTFFNSLGSINFNADVNITGSASGLILVSDVHVVDGATITVDGNLVIDGSVVDSPGRFDLVVEPTGEFTMARTVFDSGDIVLNSGASLLYDNRFVDATITVATGVDGAEVYHNITDDLAWLTDNGDNTVTTVDAWGNLTDASLTQNNLLLGLDIGTLTNRTQDSEGNIFIQPADTFLGTVDVSALQTKIAGFEVLLGYNTNYIDAAALLLEDDWDVVIVSVDDDSTVIGKLDRAIGLSFDFSDPAGSSADQNVTDVEMTAGTSEGETLFFQRVKLASDTFGGETRLTAGGATPSFLTPFTANSGTITVDGTVPVIADTATYASVTQGGDDMTAVGVLTIQGNLDIKATASDALAGIDAVDAVVELVGPATYTATQAGTSVITVGSENATEYDFDYEVTASTQNGVYNVEFTVTDRSGNQSTEVLGAIEINKNQVDLEIELQGLVAGPLSRDVELVFTDISGAEIESRTESIIFTNGIGSLTLNEVDGNSHRISAKTAWTLRQRLEIGLDTDGQATVAFTGTSKLLGGDIDGSNSVGTSDYSILSFYFNKVNSQADISGSGFVGTIDFSILASNFNKGGAPR